MSTSKDVRCATYFDVGESEAVGAGAAFQTRDYGVDLVEPYEALVGITVRVKKAHWNPGFAGMRGTIERRFGDPEYPAFDVRLEDGGLELFWFHQLDRAEGPIHAAFGYRGRRE